MVYRATMSLCKVQYKSGVFDLAISRWVNQRNDLGFHFFSLNQNLLKQNQFNSQYSHILTRYCFFSLISLAPPPKLTYHFLGPRTMKPSTMLTQKNCTGFTAIPDSSTSTFSSSESWRSTSSIYFFRLVWRADRRFYKQNVQFCKLPRNYLPQRVVSLNFCYHTVENGLSVSFSCIRFYLLNIHLLMGRLYLLFACSVVN